MRYAVLLASSLLLMACDLGPDLDGTGPSGAGCTAGAEQSCSCLEAQGSKVCGDDGVYGMCSCGATPEEIEACIEDGGTEEECADGSDWVDDGICSFAENEVANEEGGVHGDICDSDDDCRYGTCFSSPLITGGTFKICTKQCNCGENSECSSDGKVEGFESTCLRFGVSVYPDEPMTAFCQRECSSVADCKSFSELYTDCRVVVGATRVCTVTPRECQSIADCKSFSELYTDCRVVVGATRVCTAIP
jgi:hypothetical protein